VVPHQWEAAKLVGRGVWWKGGGRERERLKHPALNNVHRERKNALCVERGGGANRIIYMHA
jgi:hypothetical protein